MGLPAKCTFCGVPGRRGYNTPMPVDVKFVKFYPPTSAWEGIIVPNKRMESFSLGWGRSKNATRLASRRVTFFLRPQVGVQEAPPHPDRAMLFIRLFLPFTYYGRT